MKKFIFYTITAFVQSVIFVLFGAALVAFGYFLTWAFVIGLEKICQL